MTLDVLIGDCRDVLPTLDDCSVQCVCTSPPYWNLRDYQVAGQLGMEPTLGEYVANLVSVFRALRRVMRDDAVAWLNLGDCYVDKQLQGVPWKVAFALQDDGWILRSDVVWSKPNCMPESVTDRPTRSHEYLFLLSKSATYYYDADAIREPHSEFSTPQTKRVLLPSGDAGKHKNMLGNGSAMNPAGRNRRTVWTVPTAPYSARALLNGTPGTVSPDCPVHGDSPLARAIRQQALDDERKAIQLRGSPGKRSRRVQAPASESVTMTWLNSDSDYSEDTSVEHTTGSTNGNRTPVQPSSVYASSANGETPSSTSRIPTVDAPRPYSPDSQDRAYVEPATPHSNGSHRTDLDPVTNSAYTPSDQTAADTGDTSASPASNEHADHTHESSTAAGSASGVTVIGPLAETQPDSVRISCTCIITDHFATFPEKLIEPCILAGSSPQACAVCGAPWRRVVEREQGVSVAQNRPKRTAGMDSKTSTLSYSGGSATWQDQGPKSTTVGWCPTCAHDAPGGTSVVLDPFFGSGTTGRVALKHGRACIGIELNQTYIEEQAMKRTDGVQMSLESWL